MKKCVNVDRKLEFVVRLKLVGYACAGDFSRRRVPDLTTCLNDTCCADCSNVNYSNAQCRVNLDYDS
jgi:hypothetical protein